MKYFLSQPMTGHSPEYIIDTRDYTKEIISSIHPDWEMIDSLLMEDPPKHIKEDDHVGVYFLGKSIMLLAEADVIVVVNNAHFTSRGCSCEFMIGNLYKIPIYLLDLKTKELKLYNIEDDFIEMEEVIKGE